MFASNYVYNKLESNFFRSQDIADLSTVTLHEVSMQFSCSHRKNSRCLLETNVPEPNVASDELIKQFIDNRIANNYIVCDRWKAAMI